MDHFWVNVLIIYININFCLDIASQNPGKFNLSQNDIEDRRNFLAQTREFIQRTKKSLQIDFDDLQVNSSSSNNKNRTNQKGTPVNIRVPDLISNQQQSKVTSRDTNGEYNRLNDHDESDYEVDTRGLTNYNNKPTVVNLQNQFNDNLRSHQSIQLQHEVNSFNFKILINNN
jgi:hypothetical protein